MNRPDRCLANHYFPTNLHPQHFSCYLFCSNSNKVINTGMIWHPVLTVAQIQNINHSLECLTKAECTIEANEGLY